MKSSIRFIILSFLGFILLVSCEKEKNRLPMDADGNAYDTVVIGRQVWLSGNLKTTKNNSGFPISLVTDNAAWSALGSAACGWYNNDVSYKNSYGALYNWYAAKLNTSICPNGYHVAEKEEWLTLINFLKEAPKEIEQSFNINQVGFRVWNGSFTNYGDSWWIYSTDGSAYHINSARFEISSGMPKNSGYYIRCLKDR
jgi:uncharacterized protein (TIGR02145 family)